ncbi:hypothetical protein GCM10027589_46870 [Actinocorallia lasiicapitis]
MTKKSAAFMAGVFAMAAGGFAMAPQASAAETGCRTYSSVQACGNVELNASQQQCVSDSVGQGMTASRATVECHAFA